MASLRTEEGAERYRQHRAHLKPGDPCALCTEKPIQEFKHWKIMKNNFPYDRVAEIHDMILPIRHVTEKDITQEEWMEYQQIKNEVLGKKYEYIIEATPGMKSIPRHFHLHLIVTSARS